MNSHDETSRCDVILVAGGLSRRYGEASPKQFDLIHGRPLYFWSLEVFLKWPRTGSVVLVVPECWVGSLQDQVPRPVRVVAGGATRQISAANGVAVLNDISSENQWVMIHDGARPAFTESLLENLWNSCTTHRGNSRFGGAVPGLPAGETIKITTGGEESLFVTETLPRNSLRIIQTPQLLKRAPLGEAYGKFEGFQAADDACLLEKSGFQIRVVDGEYENIKITFAEDKERVSNWLRKRYPQV